MKVQDWPYTNPVVSNLYGKPPRRQLMLTEGRLTAQDGKFFEGRGSVVYERSEIDPTYILEPKKIVGGFYGVEDLFRPLGKIVHRYE